MDTVYDLEGPGTIAGFSVGSPVSFGADLIYPGSTFHGSNDLPSGMQFDLGIGVGMDYHAIQTQTNTTFVLSGSRSSSSGLFKPSPWGQLRRLNEAKNANKKQSHELFKPSPWHTPKRAY